MKFIATYLGAFTGQLGKTFVFFIWKGIKVGRAYVIPSNPKTPAQISQRELFAAVINFGQEMLGTIIQKFWKKYAVGMSEFNAWMSSNLLSWTTTTDYPNAKISKGTMTPTSIDSSTYSLSTGDCVISWSGAATGNQLSDDLAVIVIVDVVNNKYYISDGNASRNEGTLQVPTHSGLTAANLKSYLFFYSNLGKSNELVSNSDYSQVTQTT